MCNECSICEATVKLGGRLDKISLKYRPSTLQADGQQAIPRGQTNGQAVQWRSINKNGDTVIAPQYLNLVLDLELYLPCY